MANTSVDGVTKNSDAVARYAFCAPDSVEGKDRDFELMVLQDRTCFWEDVQGRLAIRQDKFLTVKSLFGDTAAEAELKREREGCTFAGTPRNPHPPRPGNPVCSFTTNPVIGGISSDRVFSVVPMLPST